MATDSSTPSIPNAPAANVPTAGQTVGPDLGGLIQPGTAVGPNQQTAAAGSAQEAYGKAAANYQAASDEAAKPTPTAAPPKHATLLRMVEGLGIGLSSASTALATKGKEGGAPEVQDYYAKKQEQQIQSQQAAQAQKDARVRQQLMAGQANEAMGQSYLHLATLPNDLRASDVKLQSEQAGLQTQQTENTKAQAEFRQQYGLSPEQFDAAMSGKATDPAVTKSISNFATQKVTAGAQVLGADDPTVKLAQQVISDPASTPAQIFDSVASVTRAMALKGQVTTAQEASARLASTQALIAQRSDLLAKLSTNPKLLDDPSTQAALDRIIADPNASADQINQARDWKSRAEQANAAYLKQQEDVAAARGAAYGKGRYSAYLDEQGNLITTSNGDAAARHLTPATGGTKAMSQLAQISDIRQGSDALRKAILDNKGTQFSPDAVAKLTVAMNEQDPTLARNEFKNLASSNLTPAQQDLVTALAQMNERVLSVRNIAGMGQGSEQTRNAILSTVPNITSGNTSLALKQLDAVNNLIDNLARGIPGVNVNRPTANSPEAAATPVKPNQPTQSSPDPFAAVGGKRR